MPSNHTEIAKWGKDQHPSVELLRQHEEGTLPNELNHELESHLLDCELCTDIADGLVLTNRTRTRSNVYKISKRIQNRIRKQRKRTIMHGLSDWRVLVALLMLFCLLGLFIFFHYINTLPSKQGQKEVPELTTPETTR